jgi:hypothetical protein
MIFSSVSQPQVNVFEDLLIYKIKYKRIYIKSIPDNYEYPINYSTKDILVQNTRKKKRSRFIK